MDLWIVSQAGDKFLKCTEIHLEPSGDIYGSVIKANGSDYIGEYKSFEKTQESNQQRKPMLFQRITWDTFRDYNSPAFTAIQC